MALLMLALLADLAASGIKALEAKDYAAAERSFRAAVAADAKDYSAHFHLALTLSLLGRDDDAIPEYRATLDLKPGLYEAQLNLGVILAGKKLHTEAIPLLEAAAAKRPSAPRPRVYLGDAYLAAGDPVKAEANYRAAGPLDAATHVGLGRALARQGKTAEAVEHYRAAAVDPVYKTALLELAQLFEDAKRPDDAIALYAEFPGDPGAQERLGLLLTRAGRGADAVAALEKAVAASPTSANRVALVMAYRAAKDNAKATETALKAAEADPRNPELRMLLGSLLRDQRQFRPAAQQFFAATQLTPASKEAWSELAGVLILAEQYPEAVAALDKVRALGGESTAHLFFRAIVLDKTKNYKPALESYEKFLAQAGGKFPDEEFQARQRVRLIKKELDRR